MPRAIVGSGGVASLLALTMFATNEKHAPEHAALEVVLATENDDLFSQAWPMETLSISELEALEVAGADKPRPSCEFYLGNVTHETDSCSPFTISRLSGAIASKALARATACAVDAETDCVLSVDVGFAVPTAFILEENQTALEAVVAPRLIEASEETTAVRIEHPGGAGADGLIAEFSSALMVEYMQPLSRSVVRRRMVGQAAYCVQLLRRAYSPACWAKLD